jgi:23S rRNA (guanosine2251-2'-O)-methyltransferase
VPRGARPGAPQARVGRRHGGRGQGLGKRADLWSYAAAEDGDAIPEALDLTGGVVLVLGAEGAGIRPLVRQRCDAVVRIPMHGAIASLNVAVAASLLLYEAARQRRNARP